MTNYLDKLPDFSFAYHNVTGELIMIKKGETGYFPQKDLFEKTVDELNEYYEVTKPQAEAMFHASMFGWDIPASNPDMWEEKLKDKEEFYHHNVRPEHIK